MKRRSVVLEVLHKEKVFDSVAEEVLKGVYDMGINSVKGVKFSHLFMIGGGISDSDVKKISEDILVDPVVQITRKNTRPGQNDRAIEVWFKPGVTDTVAASAKRAIKDIGIDTVDEIHYGRKYVVKGKVTEKELCLIAGKLLSNSLIEHYKII